MQTVCFNYKLLLENCIGEFRQSVLLLPESLTERGVITYKIVTSFIKTYPPGTCVMTFLSTITFKVDHLIFNLNIDYIPRTFCLKLYPS